MNQPETTNPMKWADPRLYVMMFLQYAVWGIWMPILPSYLKASVEAGGLGFNGYQVGWILATAAAVGAMKVLNAHLEGRDWIVGDALSVADLSCIGYMYYSDEYDFDWSSVPNLTAWRDRIAALPGWKHPYDLMPGHPIG